MQPGILKLWGRHRPFVTAEFKNRLNRTWSGFAEYDASAKTMRLVLDSEIENERATWTCTKDYLKYRDLDVFVLPDIHDIRISALAGATQRFTKKSPQRPP